jgi:hypothetical protein
VEKECCLAVGALIVLIAHGRAAGWADGLPTFVAKAIFQVKRQATLGAMTGKGIISLAPGRNGQRLLILILIILELNSTVRAGGGVRWNLSIAFGAIDSVACSALWARC